MRLCACLSVCLTLVLADYGHEDENANLLKDLDWDCEATDNWKIKNGVAEVVADDAFTGSGSFKVSARTNINGGVIMRVPGALLRTNTVYYYSLFVKQLTERADGKMYSYLRTLGKYKTVSGTTSNFNLAKIPFTYADDDWKNLASDFTTPGEELNYVDFWIRCEPMDVEYLVDSVSLTLVPAYNDLVADTNAAIDEHRKTDIQITGSVPAGSTVQVELTNHLFGFGTALRAPKISSTDPADIKYRDFILDHFNWAVFENDMKWKPMEKWKGNIKFGVVDKAMEILLAAGIKVRGHAITWDILENNPDFVMDEAGQELLDDIDRREKYMSEHYKGQLVEWDVCNEYLHQHFFEARTSIHDVIESQFDAVAQVDGEVGLFLNDYEILRNGVFTSAIADLARFMKNVRGVKVDGIGIQSHLRDIPIRPEILRRRLETVGTADLPITITEFSAHSYDMDTRARAVEESYRIYFADKNVHAILLWGFCDHYPSFADDFYLFNWDASTNKYTANAAGQKYLDLLEEWSTNETIDGASGSVDSTIRGFYGDYTVTVTNGGSVVSSTNFSVTRNGDNVISL